MKKYVLGVIALSFAFSCKSVNQNKGNSNESLVDQFSKSEYKLPRVSVHRGGGYMPMWPENCLESFQYVSSKMPCIIECDIEMSKDSVLVLMHDQTLDRTSTGKGKVSALEYKNLLNYSLKDNFGNTTTYKIPTLNAILTWGKNNVIYTLDVKKTTPFRMVTAQIKDKNAYSYAAVITYNLKEAVEVYNLDPKVLISVSLMQVADYERFHEAGIPDKNMVAFIGTREPKKELINFLHAKNIKTILGVLGNLDKKAEAANNTLYSTWASLGVDIFATDRPFDVHKEIKQ